MNGTLVDRGALGIGGTIDLGHTGLLALDSPVSGGTVDFTGTGGVLAIGDPASVTLTLQGVAGGDLIDLTTIGYDTGHMSVTYASGQELIYDNGSEVADLHLGGLGGDTLVVKADGNGHTEIAFCFYPGTRIGRPTARSRSRRCRLATW